MQRRALHLGVFLTVLTLGGGVGAYLWSAGGGGPASLEDLTAARRSEFEAGFSRARESIRAKRPREATRYLDGCAEIFGHDPRLLGLQGRVKLVERTRPRRRPAPVEEEDALIDFALESAEEALRLDPDCVEALELRYEILRHSPFRRYDPDGALDAGQALVRIRPHDFDFEMDFVVWLLGPVRFRRGGEKPSFDSAIGLEIAQAHLERILEGTPVGTEAYAQVVLGLSNCLVQMGDFESAVDLLSGIEEGTTPDLQGETLLAKGFSPTFRCDR